MFATRAQLEDRYTRETVSRLSETADDPDGSAAVGRALSDASATIAASLGGRYALPLGEGADTPPVLVRICCDLAIASLASLADQLITLYETREKAARADLKAIARGEMTLGLPTAGGPAGPGPRPVVTGGPARQFTRDQLREL